MKEFSQTQIDTKKNQFYSIVDLAQVRVQSVRTLEDLRKLK